MVVMKNNYQLTCEGKAVKSIASKKICETLTLVNEVLLNPNTSNEVCDKIFEKHMKECWRDYAEYANKMINRKNNKFTQLECNNFFMYLNRVFSLQTLVYNMTNQEIKKLLYEDMKIDEVFKKLDINQMEFEDLFCRYKVQVFNNGQFIKIERLN